MSLSHMAGTLVPSPASYMLDAYISERQMVPLDQEMYSHGGQQRAAGIESPAARLGDQAHMTYKMQRSCCTKSSLFI